MTSQGWEDRKIQRHGHKGEYYRINIPQEFGEGLDRVEYQQANQYLIVRPANQEGGEKEISLPLSEISGDEISEVRFQRLILKVLQRLWVSGFDKITIEYPDDIDDGMLNNFLMDLQLINLLEWNTENSTFEVKSGFEFANHIKNTADFVERYFLGTMKSGLDDGIIQKMEREEENLDKSWALATRGAYTKFFEFGVDEYPIALGGIYIGKYLERLGDLVQNWAYIIHNDLDTTSPLVKLVREEMYKIFSEPYFPSQVREVSEDSYRGEIGPGKCKELDKMLTDRNDRLDQLGEIVLQEDINLDENGEFLTGVTLGELISITRQISRFPRTIALVGLSTNYVMKRQEFNNKN